MREDIQLIKQAQKGDALAFEQLIYQYDRQVLNIALSFRYDEEDAKDIYQEVFLRVYNGLKNFKFKSEFSTWLFRITTNVCITYKEKKERHTHDSLDREVSREEDETRTLSDMIQGDDSADDLAVNSEHAEYIQSALNILPPQQRMAFTLKYFDGYKIKEISKMMQCKEGTIKRYIFNATEKMRDRLKGVFERG